MNTGPGAGGECLRKARAAWGRALPDWVAALAEECDRTTLRRAAATIGASPTFVSFAINNKRVKLAYVRERVERTIMAAMVACPVLGLIGRNECLRMQAEPFSPANPLAVQRYRACRSGCKWRQTSKQERHHAE